jgi:hypothetical protein
MAEGTSFQDADADLSGGGGKNKKFTYNDLLMGLIKKVHDTTFCEWHGGYTKQNTIALDNNRMLVTESHVDNSRSIFCNAVMTLLDMLYCRMMDEELKEKAHDIHALMTEIESLKEDDYKTDACIKPHRKLLRILHEHLDNNNYYGDMDSIADGLPESFEQDASVDLAGNIVLGPMPEKKEV